MIEKPRSPVGMTIPEWCQGNQRRIEAAQREYLVLKSHEEPEEALNSQGDVEMSEPSNNLVEKQVSELAQHMVHLIQACSEEKDVLEE